MIKVSDWVTTKTSRGKGIVKRVAKDGSWADVKWSEGWTKRMKTEYLTILTSVGIGDWTITDITRERELKEADTNA